MMRILKGIAVLIAFIYSATEVRAQTLQLYDLGLVGSFKDNGAVLPQESGLDYGGLLRSGLRFNSSYHLQLDAGYARIGTDIDVYMIGIRNSFQNSTNLWSASIGYIDLNPFKSYLLGVDYEHYANDLLTITTGLKYEIKNLDEDFYYYDFSFMLYFTDELMLRSGIAFTGKRLGRPLFEAILGFEYLPKTLPVSFYFELGNELVFQNQIGLKYHFGRKTSLKERHRSINMSTRFL